ncbi:hypothetical protein GW17_00040769 [Ensete ventricosum]|nr:hypothetical protein GW17_00040769 [Ensete ventricosum]
MAATKSAGGVSSNYIDGPARRNGKSRRLTDQGKGLRDDCLQRPFNGIPWSQGILSLMVCCIFCTQRWSPSKVPDFIGEIIYTPTEAVHMIGRYVDDRRATRHREAVLKSAADWRTLARDAMATERGRGRHNGRLPPGASNRVLKEEKQQGGLQRVVVGDDRRRSQLLRFVDRLCCWTVA